MSKFTANDLERPEWQVDRGIRFGNKRKEQANLKWKDRKGDRRADKKEWKNDEEDCSR